MINYITNRPGMGPGLKHQARGFAMKRTKFAVYVYGANGSTVEFRGDFIDDSQAKVALDLLARLASISDNKPAQMYLEQIALDVDNE